MGKAEPLAGMNKPLETQTDAELKSNLRNHFKNNQHSKTFFTEGKTCFLEAETSYLEGIEDIRKGLEYMNAVLARLVKGAEYSRKGYEYMDTGYNCIVELENRGTTQIIEAVAEEATQIPLFPEDESAPAAAPRRRGKSKKTLAKEAAERGEVIPEETTDKKVKEEKRIDVATPFSKHVDVLMILGGLKSLAELATKAKLDLSTVRRLYKQLIRPTKIKGREWSESMTAFAHALGCTPEDLLGNLKDVHARWTTI